MLVIVVVVGCFAAIILCAVVAWAWRLGRKRTEPGKMNAAAPDGSATPAATGEIAEEASDGQGNERTVNATLPLSAMPSARSSSSEVMNDYAFM